MAEDTNRGSVTFTLRDVHGQLISDDVEITFYNQKVHSLSRRRNVKFKGRPITVTGVAAFPTGLVEVFIKPKKYRYKSIFLNVLEGAPNTIDQDFFVDPEKARPRLMDFDDLRALPFGAELKGILAASKLHRQVWDKLDKRNRATILNLCAKMHRETIAKNGQTLLSHIDRIDSTWLDKNHQERIYAVVRPGLLTSLRKYPARFRGVSGGLHKFPAGWTPVTGQNSFKTPDAAGNIQLTFAEGGGGVYLADIDLDDHSGVQHAADVLKHKITSSNTNPYNMHQILVYFQQLDPGYRLL